MHQHATVRCTWTNLWPRLQVGVLVRCPTAQLLQAPLLSLLQAPTLQHLRVRRLRHRRLLRRVGLLQILRVQAVMWPRGR